VAKNKIILFCMFVCMGFNIQADIVVGPIWNGKHTVLLQGTKCQVTHVDIPEWGSWFLQAAPQGQGGNYDGFWFVDAIPWGGVVTLIYDQGTGTNGWYLKTGAMSSFNATNGDWYINGGYVYSSFYYQGQLAKTAKFPVGLCPYPLQTNECYQPLPENGFTAVYDKDDNCWMFVNRDLLPRPPSTYGNWELEDGIYNWKSSVQAVPYNPSLTNDIDQGLVEVDGMVYTNAAGDIKYGVPSTSNTPSFTYDTTNKEWIADNEYVKPVEGYLSEILDELKSQGESSVNVSSSVYVTNNTYVYITNNIEGISNVVNSLTMEGSITNIVEGEYTNNWQNNLTTITNVYQGYRQQATVGVTNAIKFQEYYLQQISITPADSATFTIPSFGPVQDLSVTLSFVDLIGSGMCLLVKLIITVSCYVALFRGIMELIKNVIMGA